MGNHESKRDTGEHREARIPIETNKREKFRDEVAFNI